MAPVLGLAVCQSPTEGSSRLISIFFCLFSYLYNGAVRLDRTRTSSYDPAGKTANGQKPKRRKQNSKTSCSKKKPSRTNGEKPTVKKSVANFASSREAKISMITIAPNLFPSMTAKPHLPTDTRQRWISSCPLRIRNPPRPAFSLSLMEKSHTWKNMG